MRRISVTCVFIFLIVVLASCGGSEEAAIERPGGEAPEVAEGNSAKESSSCLQAYKEERPTCDLVSLETMQSIFPDANEIEVRGADSAPEPVRKMFKGRCTWSWDTDRTVTIEHELPTGDVLSGEQQVSAQVIVGGISKMSLKTFRTAYRTPTEEEKAEIEERFAQQVEKEEAAEDLTDEQKDLGEEIVGNATSEMKYEAVDGLGRAAAWGKVGSSQLVVLHRDTKFQVDVIDAYEEGEKNKQAAIEIARAVLANCE
ncbi:MAG: hypothetical protein R3338_05865 [Thermoanaerobaculia bacterium]|nr:hypothetical protein [Thermoanaerobaculia bacterium]